MIVRNWPFCVPGEQINDQFPIQLLVNVQHEICMKIVIGHLGTQAVSNSRDRVHTGRSGSKHS